MARDLNWASNSDSEYNSAAEIASAAVTKNNALPQGSRGRLDR
jgi:hypothetical protein